MSRKDFDFIVDLKQKFFSQRKIQNTLRVIEENDITGWEPWWQVEFATFLAMHEGKHEWYREHQIDVDRRKLKDKTKLIADFTIRPWNHAKDRYILLEMKQNSSVTTCITNMAKDTIKVHAAKATSIDQRSFWTVGVHPKESKAKVRDIINETAEEYEIKLFDICTKYIPNTNFAFTIF